MTTTASDGITWDSDGSTIITGDIDTLEGIRNLMLAQSGENNTTTGYAIDITVTGTPLKANYFTAALSYVKYMYYAVRDTIIDFLERLK